MGSGVQRRIQEDLLEEIEKQEGASFSEKLRQWRLKEVEKTLETVQNLTDVDKPLTVDDLVDGLEERIDQVGTGTELTLDDIDDVVRDAVKDTLEEFHRRR